MSIVNYVEFELYEPCRGEKWFARVHDPRGDNMWSFDDGLVNMSSGRESE